MVTQVHQIAADAKRHSLQITGQNAGGFGQDLCLVSDTAFGRPPALTGRTAFVHSANTSTRIRNQRGCESSTWTRTETFANGVDSVPHFCAMSCCPRSVLPRDRGGNWHMPAAADPGPSQSAPRHRDPSCVCVTVASYCASHSLTFVVRRVLAM